MAGPDASPLDAVAVKRAIARPGVAGGPHNPRVADLGMMASEDGPTRYDESRADAGSDCDIRVVGEPLRIAPTALCRAAPITSVVIPTGSESRRVK